jgi:hypothetical protein
MCTSVVNCDGYSYIDTECNKPLVCHRSIFDQLDYRNPVEAVTSVRLKELVYLKSGGGFVGIKRGRGPLQITQEEMARSGVPAGPLYYDIPEDAGQLQHFHMFSLCYGDYNKAAYRLKFDLKDKNKVFFSNDKPALREYAPDKKHQYIHTLIADNMMIEIQYELNEDLSKFRFDDSRDTLSLSDDRFSLSDEDLDLFEPMFREKPMDTHLILEDNCIKNKHPKILDATVMFGTHICTEPGRWSTDNDAIEVDLRTYSDEIHDSHEVFLLPMSLSDEALKQLIDHPDMPRVSISSYMALGFIGRFHILDLEDFEYLVRKADWTGETNGWIYYMNGGLRMKMDKYDYWESYYIEDIKCPFDKTALNGYECMAVLYQLEHGIGLLIEKNTSYMDIKLLESFSSLVYLDNDMMRDLNLLIDFQYEREYYKTDHQKEVPVLEFISLLLDKDKQHLLFRIVLEKFDIDNFYIILDYFYQNKGFKMKEDKNFLDLRRVFNRYTEVFFKWDAGMMPEDVSVYMESKFSTVRNELYNMIHMFYITGKKMKSKNFVDYMKRVGVILRKILSIYDYLSMFSDGLLSYEYKSSYFFDVCESLFNGLIGMVESMTGRILGVVDVRSYVFPLKYLVLGQCDEISRRSCCDYYALNEDMVYLYDVFEYLQWLFVQMN